MVWRRLKGCLTSGVCMSNIDYRASSCIPLTNIWEVTWVPKQNMSLHFVADIFRVLKMAAFAKVCHELVALRQTSLCLQPTLQYLAYPDNRAISNCVCPDALCPCHFPCPAFEGGLEVTTPAVVVAVIQVVIEDARRNIEYEWIVFNNYVIEIHWKRSWYVLIPRCRISFLVYVYLKKTTLWLVNIALYR